LYVGEFIPSDFYTAPFYLKKDESENSSENEIQRFFGGIYLDNVFHSQLKTNLVTFLIVGNRYLEENESILLSLLTVDQCKKLEDENIDLESLEKMELKIDIYLEESFKPDAQKFTFYENKTNQKTSNNYVFVIGVPVHKSTSSPKSYCIYVDMDKTFTISNFLEAIQNYCRSENSRNPKNFTTFNRQVIFNNIIQKIFEVREFVFPGSSKYTNRKVVNNYLLKSILN